jgi:hypothetical protein
MIELLKIFSLVSLIITHPFEQIPLGKIFIPQSNISFVNELKYVAPNDGYIKSIIGDNGFYQVTLSLDNGSEIIYSGLTEIIRNTEERIFRNEVIGIDNAISPNTKFILILYEHANLFPQFINGELTFIIDTGNRIYAVADGMISDQYFDQNGSGLFSRVKMPFSSTAIVYSHLRMFLKKIDTIVYQGDSFAISGNTGLSASPRLSMRFEDEILGKDIRAIYFRSVMVTPR